MAVDVRGDQHQHLASGHAPGSDSRRGIPGRPSRAARGAFCEARFLEVRQVPDGVRGDCSDEP
jgi:hypothetical protein